MTPLTRSNTRITLLEYCQKKYFLSYYGHAIKDIDVELWKTNSILRKLKSLDMRMGEMTHKLIARYLHELKRGIQPDIIVLKKNIADEMSATFSQSKTIDYSSNGHIDFGLSEHFYGEDIDALLTPTITKVEGNLDAFLKSEWHEKIQNRFRTGHHIYIENPEKTDFDLMKVDVEHIPGLEHIGVMAAPDFGAVFGENKYIILDWKSGKESLHSDELSDQLKIYGLKLLLKQHTQELANREISAYELYLPSLSCNGRTLTQQDIDTVIQRIKDDTTYQKQFLVDQDPSRNIPLSSPSFARTTSTKKCATCTLRRVCEQLKSHE